MPDAGSRKKSLKKSLLLNTLLSLAVSASTAYSSDSDSYDEAIIAYLNDQYEIAIEHLKVGAQEGHAQSKYLLGTMYLSGLGTEPDTYTGFKLCKEAAEAGVVDAQFQVGLLYWEGEVATEDQYEAEKWLALAAKAGHTGADEVLHVMWNVDFGFGC